MKILSWKLTFIIFLSVQGCTKEKTPSELILGKWKEVSAEHYLDGKIYQPIKDSPSNKYEISQNDFFECFEFLSNGKVIQSINCNTEISEGNYSINENTLIYEHSKLEIITLNDSVFEYKEGSNWSDYMLMSYERVKERNPVE